MVHLTFILFICFIGRSNAQDPAQQNLPGPPAPRQQRESQEKCDPASQKRGGEIYREIAEESGGLFFDGGIESTPDDLLAIVLDDSERIASERGIIKAGEEKKVSVVVDGGIRYVNFMLNYSHCDELQLSVLRPGGIAIQPTDTHVKLGESKGLLRVRVDQPVVGTWQVVVKGSGRFHFIANAKSSIEFAKVYFERPVLGLMHPSAQDVGSELLLNEEVYYDAWFFGEFKNVAFELITPEGRLLEALPIHPEALDQHGGMFTPKSLYEKFQIKAFGVDSNGNSFTRVAPAEFSVRSLVVREDPQFKAKPGHYGFEVQNAGPPQRVKVTAETTYHLPLKLSEEFLDLARGASEKIDIELLADKNAALHSEMLIVTAISTANAELRAQGSVDISPPKK